MLIVKSILISYTVYPLDLEHPERELSPGSKILDATSMFDISNLIVSIHKVFLYLLSICSVCFTDVGIAMPYVCDDFLTEESTGVPLRSHICDYLNISDLFLAP